MGRFRRREGQVQRSCVWTVGTAKALGGPEKGQEVDFGASFSPDAGERCCWNSHLGNQTFHIPKGILQHQKTWFLALTPPLTSPVTLSKSLPGAHASLHMSNSTTA